MCVQVRGACYEACGAKYVDCLIDSLVSVVESNLTLVAVLL